MSCARASGETSRNLQLAEKYMRECGECPEGLRIRDEINWRGRQAMRGLLASSNGVPLENWVRWVAPPRYKYARPKPGFVHLLPPFHRPANSHTMGAGAVATTGVNAAYGHLIDPNRKWYNNKRYAVAFLSTSLRLLNTLAELSTSTSGFCFCTWRLSKLLAYFSDKLLLGLITSSTNGYDGSMMNGLQSLDQWNNYFGHPHGSKLGLLNAIQVRLPPPPVPPQKLISPRISARSRPTPFPHTWQTASAVVQPSSSARSSCALPPLCRPRPSRSACSLALGKSRSIET